MPEDNTVQLAETKCQCRCDVSKYCRSSKIDIPYKKYVIMNLEGPASSKIIYGATEGQLEDALNCEGPKDLCLKTNWSFPESVAKKTKGTYRLVTIFDESHKNGSYFNFFSEDYGRLLQLPIIDEGGQVLDAHKFSEQFKAELQKYYRSAVCNKVSELTGIYCSDIDAYVEALISGNEGSLDFTDNVLQRHFHDDWKKGITNLAGMNTKNKKYRELRNELIELSKSAKKDAVAAETGNLEVLKTETNLLKDELKNYKINLARKIQQDLIGFYTDDETIREINSECQSNLDAMARAEERLKSEEDQSVKKLLHLYQVEKLTGRDNISLDGDFFDKDGINHHLIHEGRAVVFTNVRTDSKNPDVQKAHIQEYVEHYKGTIVLFESRW